MEEPHVLPARSRSKPMHDTIDACRVPSKSTSPPKSSKSKGAKRLWSDMIEDDLEAAAGKDRRRRIGCQSYTSISNHLPEAKREKTEATSLMEEVSELFESRSQHRIPWQAPTPAPKKWPNSVLKKGTQ
ncbi:hypothetical protein ACLMJK_008945 [Lecanora helva]